MIKKQITMEDRLENISIAEQIASHRAIIDKIRGGMNQVIVGQGHLVDSLLISLLSGEATTLSVPEAAPITFKLIIALVAVNVPAFPR